MQRKLHAIKKHSKFFSVGAQIFLGLQWIAKNINKRKDIGELRGCLRNTFLDFMGFFLENLVKYKVGVPPPWEILDPPCTVQNSLTVP